MPVISAMGGELLWSSLREVVTSAVWSTSTRRFSFMTGGALAGSGLGRESVGVESVGVFRARESLSFAGRLALESSLIVKG